MTQGFLLFAHNNQQINYGLMALWSAGRIARWLNKPCSLVTDTLTAAALDQDQPLWRSNFDQILIKDTPTVQTKRYVDVALTFNNLTRADAYDLTPYDETMVIDTDIVVQSSHLNNLWGHSDDLVVMDRSSDLFGRHHPEFDWVSDYSIKFYWATQFYFRKSDYAAQFFALCQEIRSNYEAYRYLYHLPGGPVRNDHVWSIALHTMGHSVDTIPWNTPYSIATDRLVEMNDHAVKILGPQRLARVQGQDLHIMNKFDLMQHIDKELSL